MEPQQDQAMDMDTPMDTAAPEPHAQTAQPTPPQYANQPSATPFTTAVAPEMRAMVAAAQSPKEAFRDIAVKVHIRRPDRDSWVYLGRAVVTQEIVGQSSRIVIKSVSSQKVYATFGEGTALQAEKRGNFIVVSCVEGNRVVSWSLNALNNSETLRLLATVEFASYSCKAISDPHTYRRRVARLIKDDRRRRHKRRKEQDALVSAFARTGLDTNMTDDSPHPAPPPQQG